MAKTTAERCKDHKKKKKESGLVRFELWIRPEWKQAILDYIKGLK